MSGIAKMIQEGLNMQNEILPQVIVLVIAIIITVLIFSIA